MLAETYRNGAKLNYILWFYQKSSTDQSEG